MKRLLIGVCLLGSGIGARTVLASDAVDYHHDVKPLLKARCYACHGALKQEGGLRLDTVEAMLKGGESGAAIAPGQIEASALLARVSDHDESTRMPQEGPPLTTEEIAKLRAWIKQGAKPPADDAPEPDPREHWAFKRPVRPEVPKVPGSTLTIRNPIDAFIAAQHEQRGLRPVGEADKATLLRRVYLDLTGLPPSRENLQAFLADSTDDAYEKVVERLLASPQYGERWGRHWMDVWRYSDWYGRRAVSDVLNSYATIWRWRDWIVHSLNEDKGYDRMIVEMLAADEVAPEDDETIVATGFLVRNWFKWNYNQWMKDNVEHTGKAFLGLTLNCAHCHDHKYDPISQEEYFGFRAFFEPMELRHDRVPGDADPGVFEHYTYLRNDKPVPGGLVRVFDEKLDAKTLMYSRGDERSIIEGKPPVAPRVPSLLGLGRPEIVPVKLPLVASYPGIKPFIAEEDLAKARERCTSAEKHLGEVRTTLEREEPVLLKALEASQAQLAKLEAGQSTEPGPSQALAGKGSLFLDALQGRRMLTNDLASLDALQQGTQLSFQLKLLVDGHLDLQLALNVKTAATAVLLSFEQGRIQCYEPGTSRLKEIGRYDVAKGQNSFQVTVELAPQQDEVKFTVKDLISEDKKLLVDGTTGSLRGWNPTKHAEQGLVLDAQTGTVAVLDDILVTHPQADEPVLRFDFEEPAYAAGQDVVGREGWVASPLCVLPAASVVDQHATPTAAVFAARQQVARAQRALDALRLTVPAAELGRVVAEKSLASLQARVAGSRARYAEDAEADALARAASHAERMAKHATATAEVQAAELALVRLESKPYGEQQREEAKEKLAKARAAVVAATEALPGEKSDFTLLTPTFPDRSTGRRTMLAQSIAHRDNPLTARVAVNQLWMRHFGQPLVETVFDFGRNGKAPSHPELLDWLAVEFMEHGWSMKHLHRLLVTCSAYRLSSQAPADSPNAKLDPDQRFVWRYPRHRMEAEVLRDSVLHSAGLLELKLGGKEIEQSELNKSQRRTLYISHHSEGQAGLLTTFNVANPNECYRRIDTVVPQQALAMTNSELTRKASRALASRLWKQTEQAPASAVERDTVLVNAVFEQLLTRAPRPSEREAALDLLRHQRDAYRQAAAEPASADSAKAGVGASPETAESFPSDPDLRACESLIHALYSHHDFISVR